MNIPTSFIEKMSALLGSELEDFLSSLTQKPNIKGLRANTLKIQPQDLPVLLEISPEPVPWCSAGFTYLDAFQNAVYQERPSKNPLYHAGLYYLQEPSAMAPAEILGVRPGDRVLDLCAAPGGKAAQIAGHLSGLGLLVANDASATRSRALVKNLTLCGAKNVIITCETPKRLALPFKGYFDKILVDAPCSGEGMFRKDPSAVKAWVDNKPGSCVNLQREILHYAAMMLKPGGRIVYSTCTFDLSENEGQISDFLAGHKDFKAVPVDYEAWGFSEGLPPLTAAARIWPHKQKAEGHFICLLAKDEKGEDLLERGPKRQERTEQDTPTAFDNFVKSNLTAQIEGPFLSCGSGFFKIPKDLPNISGLRINRSGWYLGEIKKDRFEPSHALALSLASADAKFVYELSDQQCSRYLKGESFEEVSPESCGSPIDSESGNKRETSKPWVLVCIQGFPLGWGRLVKGRLKNKYPVKDVVIS